MDKNDMESFHLSPGYQLILYDGDNFEDESTTFTGSDVVGPNDEIFCVTLEKHWRNHARSYKVKRIADYSPTKQ